MHMFDENQSFLLYIVKDYTTQTKLVQFFSLGSWSQVESSPLWNYTPKRSAFLVLGTSQTILLYIRLGKKSSFVGVYKFSMDSFKFPLLLMLYMSVHIPDCFSQLKNTEQQFHEYPPTSYASGRWLQPSWWVQPMTSTSSRTSVSTSPPPLPSAFIWSPASTGLLPSPTVVQMSHLFLCSLLSVCLLV